MSENTEQNLEQSYATFGHRGPKTDEKPHGWYEVKELNSDEPTVLIFGGQSTTTDRAASSYCKMVEEVLDKNGCKEDVNVIGVVNHYGDSYDPFLSRSEGVNNVQECDEDKLNEETVRPQYVNDIFELAVKNRLCDEEGQKLDTKDACRKMRNLNIFVHCHGGSTFAQLEKLTWHKMKELGYSREERTQVLQELVVVAYAPYTALGKSKAKMVSFVSDTDKVVTYNNRIEDTIRYNQDVKKDKTTTCFFEGHRGNVFRTNSLGDIDQHELETLYPDESKLNADGKSFMSMLRNALVNGVKSSVSGKKRGDIKDMVSNNTLTRNYVEYLSQTGEQVWEKLIGNYHAEQSAINEYADNFRKNKYFNEKEATAERMEYLKEQEEKRLHPATMPTAKPLNTGKYRINEALYNRFISSIMNWKHAVHEMKTPHKDYLNLAPKDNKLSKKASLSRVN